MMCHGSLFLSATYAFALVSLALALPMLNEFEPFVEGGDRNGMLNSIQDDFVSWKNKRQESPTAVVTSLASNRETSELLRKLLQTDLADPDFVGKADSLSKALDALMQRRRAELAARQAEEEEDVTFGRRVHSVFGHSQQLLHTMQQNERQKQQKLKQLEHLNRMLEEAGK